MTDIQHGERLERPNLTTGGYDEPDPREHGAGRECWCGPVEAHLGVWVHREPELIGKAVLLQRERGGTWREYPAPAISHGPLPEDSAERKTYPLHGGVLAYFPAALARVANHSWRGNEKHNPGQSLHWARGKSDDHLDAAARHLLEGDLVGLCWRALAALQLQCEREGALRAPGAREG